MATASEGMIGQIGITATPPFPRAERVFVRGEYWDAISATAVPDGVPVKMTGMEQLTLFVQPIS
jgi:membrane-bound ClpP family serine protease